MKRPTDSAAFAITLLLIPAAFAQELPLDITGFGDICYLRGEDRFAMGQAEVDLGVPLDEGIDLEIAVALDEGRFSTGSWVVDFHLFGSEGNHFRPVGGIDHSGIIVGQFDVPFGLDWLVYPSIDRRLVSGPVAVENTHDFWNDFGVQGYLKAGRLDAVLFAVNGFGYETEEVVVEMNLALGGRAGIGILPQLEVGGSYAAFFDQDYALDMALIGADAQFGYRNFSAKGEFLVHRLGLTGDGNLIHTGFYVQGMYDFGDLFLVSRYGQFRPDGEEDLARLSIGGGWVIAEGCEARLEQQVNAAEEDRSLLQLVVAF